MTAGGETRYISARERLEALRFCGPVFRGQVVMQVFGWAPRRAAHYLWLWQRAGLVKPFGGKSDVYFNLAIFPGALEHLETAVRLAMPGAVVGFRTSLNEYGLTTQRPGLLDLLLRPGGSRFRSPFVTYEGAADAFWAVVDENFAIAPGDSGTIPRLTPAACLLASALAVDGYAPDDIEFDDIELRARKEFSKMAARFLPEGEICGARQDYENLWNRVRQGPAAEPQGRRRPKP